MSNYFINVKSLQTDSLKTDRVQWMVKTLLGFSDLLRTCDR